MMDVYAEFDLKLDRISTREELRSYLNELQILSYNERSNNSVLELVEKTIKLAKEVNDDLSLIKLYSLKISHLQYFKEKLPDVKKLTGSIKSLAIRLDNNDGMALFHAHMWFIYRFEGNYVLSKDSINYIGNVLEKAEISDDFIKFICQYTFAFDDWINNHNIDVINHFEDCLLFAHKNNLTRSIIQILAILCIIYMVSQNSKKILEQSKKILGNKDLFEKIPTDAKAMLYYFIGLGYMLDLNLRYAESFFQEAYNILEPIHKKSIYFSNFIILHSHMITVKALQGKIEQSWNIIMNVDQLLKQEFFIKNLDSNTKNQIQHTLNLNKFYVCSRLKDFDSRKMQDLIEEIYKGSKIFYSNFMLLQEYILNSNLEIEKLKELQSTENYSINRVKHIISFVLLRTEEDKSDELALERIEVLVNREKNENTTFIENAFSDLLIAQQLFSLSRYGDIYTLLRKYKNQLSKIEVLEMRVFMEAFIQVGSFKNGDPLGPALQYMAIKKCRLYGFSRLEDKLLYYLSIQGNDVLKINI
jgi:hypothetical protein